MRQQSGIWPGNVISTVNRGVDIWQLLLFLPVAYWIAVASLQRLCSHTRCYINHLLISSVPEIPASLRNGSAKEANLAGVRGRIRDLPVSPAERGVQAARSDGG